EMVGLDESGAMPSLSMAPMHHGPYNALYLVLVHVAHCIVFSHKQLSSLVQYVASCRLKRCLSVSTVLISLFLISPLCANAFDFGALDPNPAGRIVPYQPVYKTVHFEDVSSESNSESISMNKK